MEINIFENVKGLFDFMQNQSSSEDFIDHGIEITGSLVSGMMSTTMILAAVFFFCIFVVPIFLIAFLIYKHIKSDKKVRLELAKHGIIPPMETSKSMETAKSAPDKNRMLRNAFLCIGIGLGLVCGIIISLAKDFDTMTKFLILFASTLLFLGFAYLAFSLSVKDK